MNLKIELEEMQNVREQRIAVPSLPHCPAPGVPRDLREPGAVCPPPFGACGVCARSGGTSESLGSDLPHGGLKSLGLFQSGMVPPVTQRARARAHTHTHTHTHSATASDSFKGGDCTKISRGEGVYGL